MCCMGKIRSLAKPRGEAGFQAKTCSNLQKEERDEKKTRRTAFPPKRFGCSLGREGERKRFRTCVWPLPLAF